MTGMLGRWMAAFRRLTPPAPDVAPLVAAATGPGVVPVHAVGQAPVALDRFSTCLAIVLGHEGGFANDPQDPGGPTMMGITQETLAAWRGKPVTAEEVRALTRSEARAIYRTNYWNRLRCDDLPPGLDLMLFDFGVNAGVGRSARFLQGIVGARIDGAIGPLTLAAVRRFPVGYVLDRFADRKEEHYRGLATFPRFGRGWLRRAADVNARAKKMAEGVA